MVNTIKKFKRKFNTVCDGVLTVLMSLFFIGLGSWVLYYALSALLMVDTNYKNYTVEGEYTFEYVETTSEVVQLYKGRSSRGKRRNRPTRYARYFYPTYIGEVLGEEREYPVDKKFSESGADGFVGKNPTLDVTAYQTKKGDIYILASGVSLEEHFSRIRIPSFYYILLGSCFVLIGVLEFPNNGFGKKKRKKKKKKHDYDEDEDEYDDYHHNKKRKRKRRRND